MSAKAAPGGAKLGGEPRVQLLPPVVQQRAKSRAARRMMVFIFVVSLLVAGGASTFAYVGALQAEVALAAEQARTEQLLAEQAKYAEGAKVAGLVSASKEAQLAVTANEADWNELLDKVVAAFPEESALRAVQLNSPAPWETPLAPAGVLRSEHAIAATVSIASPAYSDAAAFVAAAYELEEEDALADVVIQSTVYESSQKTYVTVVSLTFTPDAFANRFAEQPEDAAGEGDGEDDADETGDPDGTAEDAASEPDATPTPGVTP